jgi:hypothetical protein
MDPRLLQPLVREPISALRAERLSTTTKSEVLSTDNADRDDVRPAEALRGGAL